MIITPWAAWPVSCLSGHALLAPVESGGAVDESCDVTHVAGDMLTAEGCPLLYPLSGLRFRLLPRPLAFTTGTKPELWLLDPALVAGLGLLVYRAVSTGVLTLQL